MRVPMTNINTFYSGSYAILNDRKKNSFPYSVKVEGYGSSKNNNSLFQFAKVTITDIMIKEKYGTKVTNGPRTQMHTSGSKSPEEFEDVIKEKVSEIKLPNSFESLKDLSVYYHGKNISEYELVQTAVAAGKLTLESDDTNAHNIARKAFDVLVKEQAAPKYPWSDTLYSEDGKYTFSKQENGRYKMYLIEDEEMEVSLEDIANWIMSGTPNRNIETRYLYYLKKADPDLYETAQKIGREVRTNDLMEDLHQGGVLSDRQRHYDMGLLGMMFEKDANSMRLLLNGCKKSSNFLKLLDMYSLDGTASLEKIREEQLKSGGII